MKKKIVALLLVLAAFILTLGSTAFAYDDFESRDVQDNFVLLLDCSMSLGHTDRDSLCLEACKNFLDTLPTENAKVSVVTFGYMDTDFYEYSERFSDMVNYDDNRHVHVVVPHEVLSDPQAKAEYKRTVQAKHTAGRMNQQTMTPIGHAVAAGVDILTQTGAMDSKGCLILVSDGLSDALDNRKDDKLIEYASQLAGEHGWKIYGIELNYDHSKRSEIAEADEMFDLLSTSSGALEVGRLSCEDALSVHTAFQQIINDYFGLSSGNPEWIKLPGSKDFFIPELTSESTINIFGGSIRSVQLTHLDTGRSETYDRNFDSDTVSVSVEPGSYLSLKMVCPDAGNWRITIEGEKDAKALISNCTLQEMGLRQTTKSSSTSANLYKTDSITVNACFSYRGMDQTDKPFYEKNPATLVVTQQDGSTKEFTMNSTRNGYSFELPLQGYTGGELELRTLVRNGIFRGGVKESNRSTFTIENKELYLAAGAQAVSRSAYANASVEPIDLNAIYTNPDNDYIICELSCRSDPAEQFAFERDGDKLIIQTGNRDGEYQLTLGARDAEMSRTIDCPITLTVENRAPELTKKLGKATLLAHCFPFQRAEKKQFSIDLDQYFTDPDGGALSYTVSESDGLVEIQQDGALVKLKSITEGKGTLNVTAFDGVKSTAGQLELNVQNGKSQYIKQYGILYLIGLAVVLFILVATFLVLRNKRVKGNWDFTFRDEDGMTYEAHGVDIAAFTTVGRKSSFKLSKLLPELNLFIEDDAPFSPISFTAGAQYVTLLGVYRQKGLKVRLTPPKEPNLKVTVNCNGLYLERGTASMGTGTLDIRISDSAVGSEKSIRMVCN